MILYLTQLVDTLVWDIEFLACAVTIIAAGTEASLQSFSFADWYYNRNRIIITIVIIIGR
eukprot:1550975-Ditylum_brightwellii.AAC.1